MPRLLWNLDVHYRADKSPMLFSILKQVDADRIISSCFFNIHFTIITHSILYLSGGFLPTKHWTYCFSIWTCYMSRLSHPPLCYNIKCVWWGLQIMNRHTLHFSPASCHFLALKPKYPPQYPTAEHTQPVALPHCERPRFTPTTKYTTNLYILTSCFRHTHLN